MADFAGKAALTLAAACAATIALAPLGAAAQQYPSGPIRLIVGFNPSSSADIVARMVGKHIEDQLGQPVVVENRVGNSSMIAAEQVARAPADGHTLFMATVANTIYPARTASSKFNLTRDMAPITLLGVVPSVLVAHPSVPAKDIKELLALMKSKPETLTYGTSGVGTASHLAAETLNMKLGAKIVMAHYQGGSSQRVVDLLAGRVNVAINVAISLLPHIRSGKLVPMAMAQPGRSAILPDVPSLGEGGVDGVDGGVWIGLLAPSGTPSEAIARLSAAANSALKSPDVAKAFASQGIDARGGAPDDFAKFIRQDMERWTQVASALNLRK